MNVQQPPISHAGNELVDSNSKSSNLDHHVHDTKTNPASHPTKLQPLITCYFPKLDKDQPLPPPRKSINRRQQNILGHRNQDEQNERISSRSERRKRRMEGTLTIKKEKEDVEMDDPVNDDDLQYLIGPFRPVKIIDEITINSDGDDDYSKPENPGISDSGDGSSNGELLAKENVKKEADQDVALEADAGDTDSSHNLSLTSENETMDEIPMEQHPSFPIVFLDDDKEIFIPAFSASTVQPISSQTTEHKKHGVEMQSKSYSSHENTIPVADEPEISSPATATTNLEDEEDEIQLIRIIKKPQQEVVIISESKNAPRIIDQVANIADSKQNAEISIGISISTGESTSTDDETMSEEVME